MNLLAAYCLLHTNIDYHSVLSGSTQHISSHPMPDCTCPETYCGVFFLCVCVFNEVVYWHVLTKLALRNQLEWNVITDLHPDFNFVFFLNIEFSVYVDN